MVWNLAYARQEVALVFAHKIQGHLLGHFSHLGKEEVAVQKDKHWVSEERPPMFPPSLEWAQTASMVVCARSKDSEICLCLQLVSNSRNNYRLSQLQFSLQGGANPFEPALFSFLAQSASCADH